MICRIGSLEISAAHALRYSLLICRIGSLEIEEADGLRDFVTYLPHRQLRNVMNTLITMA